MAKKSKKNNKKIIAWICGSAVVAVAAVAIALVLVFSNQKIDDSYFVSDNTKYVLNVPGVIGTMLAVESQYLPEEVHTVYFYSGNKITDEKVYYEYDDEESAKAAFESLKDLDTEGKFKNIALNGEYIVFTAEKSEYENDTTEDIKQQIEFWEQLKKMDEDDSIVD